jgi:hypothetical protein
VQTAATAETQAATAATELRPRRRAWRATHLKKSIWKKAKNFKKKKKKRRKNNLEHGEVADAAINHKVVHLHSFFFS